MSLTERFKKWLWPRCHIHDEELIHIGHPLAPLGCMSCESEPKPLPYPFGPKNAPDTTEAG